MAENRSVNVRFFLEGILNEAETEKQGRPIYSDVEMCEITSPGDRLTRFHIPALEKSLFVRDGGVGRHISRAEMFHEEYAAFKRGEARAAMGTPLEAWPILTKSRVLELKALGFLSVDDVAAASDSVLPRMGMGSRELREQARAYIDAAKGGAETQAMASKIAQLEAMLERIAGRVDVPPVAEPIAAPVAVEPAPERQEKAIADCSDDELKAFIKERSGEGVRGNPRRETLVAKATELAQAA